MLFRSVNQIPSLLGDEYNDDEFEITFKGIERDYQDLLAAANNAEKSGMSFTIKKNMRKSLRIKKKVFASCTQK